MAYPEALIEKVAEAIGAEERLSYRSQAIAALDALGLREEWGTETHYEDGEIDRDDWGTDEATARHVAGDYEETLVTRYVTEWEDV